MNTAKQSNPLLWIAPLGCFAVVLLSCGGCVILPMIGIGVASYQTITEGNEVTQLALERVKAEPRLVEEFGEPMRISSFSKGNFNTTNGRARTELRFGVAGPNGSGDVDAVAVSSGGDWQFEKLIVRTDGKSFDLLGAEGIVVEEERVEAVREAIEAEDTSGEPSLDGAIEGVIEEADDGEADEDAVKETSEDTADREAEDGQGVDQATDARK